MRVLGGRETARVLVALSQDFLQAMQDVRQRHGDFVYLRPARLLLVYDLETARRVLSGDDFERGRHNARAVRHLAGTNLQIMEGEQWRRNRTATEPQYTARAFEPSLDDADRVVRRCVTRLEAGLAAGPVDIHQELQLLMLEIVNAMYLGLDDDELAAAGRPYLDVVSREFMRYATRPLWWAFRRLPLPANRAQHDALHRFDALVRGHLAEPPSALSATEHGDHAKGLLLGSTLGLGLSILWALYYLCESPAIQSRLRAAVKESGAEAGAAGAAGADAAALASLPMARRVHLEALRMRPPAHTLQRRAKGDQLVDGRVVRSGTSILVPIHALHHDSRHWTRPDEFDPDRFDDDWPTSRAFLPFGLGARSCIARRLSLSIASLVLARFVEAFDLALEPGFRPVLQFNPEISTANGLRVVLAA